MNPQASPDDEDRRRRLRAAWPVRVHRLNEAPSDDLSGVTTAAERIGMMWELARQAWLLSGRALPTYGRETMPGRLLRAGEPRPDDDDAQAAVIDGKPDSMP